MGKQSSKGRSKPSKPSSADAKPTQSNSGLPWSSLLVAVVCLGLGILTPVWLKTATPSPPQASPEAVAETLPVQDRRTLQESRYHVPCTVEALEQYWHDQAVPGLHMVCLQDETLMIYRDSLGSNAKSIVLPATWTQLVEYWQNELELPPIDGLHQPWALFSAHGHRLVTGGDEDFDLATLQDYGLCLLFTGGQFLWPGVRIGFRREIDLFALPSTPDSFDGSRTATLETLSLWPLVLSVKGFLTNEECAMIQELAEPSIRYSDVVLMDHDKNKSASDFRTSQSTFLKVYNPTLLDIDYRTASLVRTPRTHQENVQVLRYGHTEKYDAHHDFFTPALYASDAATLRLIKDGHRNRMATVFWYLSDVKDGGHTVFPRFNKGREKDFRDCETGLKVQPETGKVIIFYSLTADGATDPYSLHGACPVGEGEIKWAANKWVWNEPMGYLSE